MKPIYLLACSFLLLIASSQAQKIPGRIYLKNGARITDNNLLPRKTSNHYWQSLRYQNKFYTLIRFDQLPGAEEKKLMARDGIVLYDYLPGKIFLAELPQIISPAHLKDYRAGGLYGLTSPSKISEKLQTPGNQPPISGDEVIAVNFFGSMDHALVQKELEKAGAQIYPYKIQPARTFFVKAGWASIHKMSELPFVSYISKQSLAITPLNYNNRAIHGVDAVSAPSGRNLQGKNVSIGMGDNADPSTHIDFAGRLILRNSLGPATHGTHTTGTAGGGGILNPKYRGMAPKATLISQAFDDILAGAPVFIHDYNMVLTNNSYFQGLTLCPGEGDYDALSNYVDSQLYNYPSLLHVFAAGNDGLITCSPYPSTYATIKSGYQSAKNVLTVGAIDNTTYLRHAGSSGGPVLDGRIKPEITAGGGSVISTITFNNYGSSSGTSMASPTATGSIALLYERYRQLHSGVDPSAALMKALICNSADDLGNPGPDFIYGFGMLNVRTAIEALEKNQFFSGSLANGANASHSIAAVPAGNYQIKTMLYWADQPGAPFAPTALVNNLDLTVTSPDGTLHHPLILDPSPAGVTNIATEGIDSINNIEQVVINAPLAGNYSIQVNGKSIPVGNQNYVVTYQIIAPSVTVEYPFGNNTFVPGETENIRWSAYGGDPNPFSIEYSPDNGSTWNMINSNVPSSTRRYVWTVPAAATNLGLVRITRNIVGYMDTSDYNFTILGQPTITVSNPCPGYGQLIWNQVPSASGYEIMMLKTDSMQTIATTTDTTYLFDALNKDSTYWIGVRAINNSTAGRRSLSVKLLPSGGPCSLASFNNDFVVDSLPAPVTGRLSTSSQLSSVPLQARIKNLGSTASSGSFDVSYQVNGGTITTETTTQTITPGATYTYTFIAPYDFSAAGQYQLNVWVTNAADPNHHNDTLTELIKQLKNDPLVLNPSFTEDFETASPQTYTSKTMGLTGLDRCDFSSTPNGRARTFINTGFARSGNFCVTLDQAVYSLVYTADSLVTTFNLSNYSGSDQIWLDYFYKKQLNVFNKPGNRIWIRGNDQSVWIMVDSITASNGTQPAYQSGKSIDVTGILANVIPAQTISSSFQVKFGEEGIWQANDVTSIGYTDAGISFDDVSLTRSLNDVGILSMSQPAFTNLCGLTNAETVTIQLKNYSASTINGATASYSVNGNIVTEALPVLSPGQTLVYSFTQKADLSAYQVYSLREWVNYSGDNYKRNDSLDAVSFHTVPLISAYPYLEGFENDDGYWFSGGRNDSWQWGEPAKTIINKAANGKKAWVTNLTGNYNNNELSYLYSPCFDLTGLNQPVLSFSHIFRTEDDCFCDFHYVQYSTDNINWTMLDTTAVPGGTNWYDDAPDRLWSKSYPIWHVSSHDIPVKNAKLRFRIVMSSDQASNFEGIGIDDIHIFDKAPVYDSSNISGGVSQNVNGIDWIHFDIAGKRIASINPNGQNLGNTTVKLFKNPAAVRDTNNQYYLDRNIVVQPSVQPLGIVTLRFYFTDSEAVHLINASGCINCTSIADAYESGVTQYSSSNQSEEDSTLTNNVNGSYGFLKPHQDVTIIPYDNGYYAEYGVRSFSEFWINGGGAGQNQALPIVLDSFTATIVDTTGLLQWDIFPGSVVDSFIIQKGTDSINFPQIIGTVKADTTVTGYQFTDKNLSLGFNYYRLKIITEQGNVQYSPVRNINYTKSNPIVNGIYPNPVSTGRIHVNTATNCNRIALYDVLGRLVKAENKTGTANEFSVANLAKGVYLLKAFTDAGTINTKIVVD
jgi:hypothetical protein